MKDHYQNVVIDVPMDKLSLDQIRYLKNSPVLASAGNVYFIHVYNKCTDSDLPLGIDCKNRDQVAAHINNELEELKSALLPEGKNGDNWKVEVLFNSDPKLQGVNFLKQVNADLAVTATRGSHGAEGLFRESFSFYMIENAPCDLYVIRPVHKS